MTEQGVLTWRVEKVKVPLALSDGSLPVALARNDLLAVEEPLEIQVQTEADTAPHTVTITMRTPGHDAELAAADFSPGREFSVDRRKLPDG